MIKKIMRVLLFFVFCSSLPVFAARWKVFVYMDSSDNLSDMAIKNLSDMLRAKPNDTIDFLVQLHAYDLTALRFRVTSDGFFIQETQLSGNSKQDFIHGAQWAFAHNDADYTMLIAWNHGWGILDPHWNHELEKWEVGCDELNNACMINRSLTRCYDTHKKAHKGFMFYLNPRTYLNNQDLVEGLCCIKKNVLQDKKLDVIAFDTCMGAMFEVGYQVAPYADYLVGNQTCALRDGFNFQGIIAALNQELAPREMVKSMVQAFDTYYKEHDEAGVYTHSALDLSFIYKAKQSLDVIVSQLLSTPELTPLIFTAREKAPRFCVFPMYTDLIAFCKNIEAQLIPSLSISTVAFELSLQDFYLTMQNLIVARCGGCATYEKTYGVSIYLPVDTIDNSYCITNFGRESQWINLLERLCNKA